MTIVDARLVRHYLGVYDRVLAARPLAERRTIEGTLAGLRFARNLMAGSAGVADLIAPPASAPGGLGPDAPTAVSARTPRTAAWRPGRGSGCRSRPGWPYRRACGRGK